jgi:hypothetical protein
MFPNSFESGLACTALTLPAASLFSLIHVTARFSLKGSSTGWVHGKALRFAYRTQKAFNAG